MPQWQYYRHCWRSERLLSKPEKVSRKLSLSFLHMLIFHCWFWQPFWGECFKASLPWLFWNFWEKLIPGICQGSYNQFTSNLPPWSYTPRKYILTITHRGTYFFYLLYLTVSIAFIYFIVLLLCLMDKKQSHGRKVCCCSSVIKREIVPYSAFCFLHGHLSFLPQTVVSERCFEKSC